MPITWLMLRISAHEADTLRRALKEQIAKSPTYYKDQRRLLDRLEHLRHEAEKIDGPRKPVKLKEQANDTE